MWIESENGTIINSSCISRIYVTENILSSEDKVALCYINIEENQTKALYGELSKEKAGIIYKNLKTLLIVNSNFISKEQLLEGTEV
ncbi:MAG: hypothetical protein WC503_06070 [Candidatus Shapirobacteria bacterium]